jgi:hypothetical protein
LLFLGSKTPSAFLDEVDDDVLLSLYGLLLAAGTPSNDSGGKVKGKAGASHRNTSALQRSSTKASSLKRSARHAMNLLKWLIMDWKEPAGRQTKKNSVKSDLNLFAVSFLSFQVSYYSHMALDIHLTGEGDRGGAKEDACRIVVLILTYHLTEDGDHAHPVAIDDLLTPLAQQSFELWMSKGHVSLTDQELMKKNAQLRQAEILLAQKQAELAGGGGGGGGDDNYDGLLDDSDHHDHSDDNDDNHDEVDHGHRDVDDMDDGDDIMAAFRKQKKQAQRDLKAAARRGDIKATQGVATRWEDSQLAREQRARAAAASAARGAGGSHETVRDSQDAAAELVEREEEKAKLLGKDPLGIIDSATNVNSTSKDRSMIGTTSDGVSVDFDLRRIDANQANQIEKALYELTEELQKAESAGLEKRVKELTAQKESLESLVDRCGGMDAMESNNARRSVLPTNPNFDPILFLTLVHRSTTYDQLVSSLSQLSSTYNLLKLRIKLHPKVSQNATLSLSRFVTDKAENQAEQLQNLVRDNFPLFVRCAEGLEEFRKSSQDEEGPGFVDRIEKLEGIAESAAYQARRSFKPLLDNTSEVRKVQSAMAVLQRIAPILQVPALMRQYLENRMYSQALKTYRRVLVVDETCNISFLNHVKLHAEKCVHEARLQLEHLLSDATAPVDELLEGIRNLSELLELDVPSPGSLEERSEAISDTTLKHGDENFSLRQSGVYDIHGTLISVREHRPSLACFLLQSAHFAENVRILLRSTDDECNRFFMGEALAQGAPSGLHDASKLSTRTGNQWKYDVLDTRVVATVQAVGLVRVWLPRLISIAAATRDDEKRRAARVVGSGRRRVSYVGGVDPFDQLSAFELFVSNVSPHLMTLVEHSAFCALGSNIRSYGKEITMTFGEKANEKLKVLLRSPLPPSQSTKVGTELADLVDILSECSVRSNALRPTGEDSVFQLSPLEECRSLGELAVVIIEKRRCIYAFDSCARACANRASSSGKFDVEACVTVLKNLSDKLSRPTECCSEVEKGCELVLRRFCEGLASYVRDRGESARLSAVCECSDILEDHIPEILREILNFTPNVDAVRDVMTEDVVGLENVVFTEYLESIRLSVASSVRIGWLDLDQTLTDPNGVIPIPPSFPSYLSASLLAIVRCRAQVEQALGNRLRRVNVSTTDEGGIEEQSVPYQHLAMRTVSDAAVQGICSEIMQRKLNLKVRQADRLANELEFLRSSLKRFLSEVGGLSIINQTLQMVNAKAGRDRNYKGGDGPDGLAALEELERLGRVYVLCLGE